MLKGVPQDNGRRLLTACQVRNTTPNLQKYNLELRSSKQAVTNEQIINTIKQRILPLFDASSSVAVVASSPNKAGEIKDSLAKYGFEVEERTLAISPEEMEDDDVDMEGDSESDASGSDDDSHMVSR